MGNKTAGIAVYPVSAFGSASKSFWFGALENILETYPFLEHPHKQLFYMLLYVEKSSGTAVVDNSPVRLDEPKVICIKPNSVFSLDINRNAKGFLFCFTETFFSLRYNNNVLYQFVFLKKEAATYVRLSARQTSRWNTLLALVQEEAVARQKDTEKVLRSYLNILLYDLDRKFHPQVAIDLPAGRDEKVIRFEQLLEEQFSRHRTPSYYARQLHITTNYLNRLCHDHRGSTSGALIRRRITIEAQRLLHYTSLSVAEVAHKLGFESNSYFITFFKKNTGTTPEHFRKKN